MLMPMSLSLLGISRIDMLQYRLNCEVAFSHLPLIYLFSISHLYSIHFSSSSYQIFINMLIQSSGYLGNG